MAIGRERSRRSGSLVDDTLSHPEQKMPKERETPEGADF